MNQMRTFKVQVTLPGGQTINTSVQVQSPGGFEQARALAESMYGGGGNRVSIMV